MRLHWTCVIKHKKCLKPRCLPRRRHLDSAPLPNAERNDEESVHRFARPSPLPQNLPFKNVAVHPCGWRTLIPADRLERGAWPLPVCPSGFPVSPSGSALLPLLRALLLPYVTHHIPVCPAGSGGQD